MTKVYLALLDGHFDRTKYKTISYRELQLKKKRLLDQRKVSRQQVIASSSKGSNSCGETIGRSFKQDEMLHVNLKFLLVKLHEVRDRSVHLNFTDDAAIIDDSIIHLQELLQISYNEYAKSWRLRKRLRKFLKSSGIPLESVELDALVMLDKVDSNKSLETSSNITMCAQDERDVFGDISKNAEYLKSECIFLCHDISPDQLSGFTNVASEVIVVLVPLVETKSFFRMNVCLGDSSQIPDKDFYQCETWMTVTAHSHFQVSLPSHTTILYCSQHGINVLSYVWCTVYGIGPTSDQGGV